MKKLNNTMEVMQALIDGKAIKLDIWEIGRWIRLADDKNMLIDNKGELIGTTYWNFSYGNWLEIHDPMIPTKEEVEKTLRYFQGICKIKCGECPYEGECPSIAPISWRIDQILEILEKEVK